MWITPYLTTDTVLDRLRLALTLYQSGQIPRSGGEWVLKVAPTVCGICESMKGYSAPTPRQTSALINIYNVISDITSAFREDGSRFILPTYDPEAAKQRKCVRAEDIAWIKKQGDAFGEDS